MSAMEAVHARSGSKLIAAIFFCRTKPVTKMNAMKQKAAPKTVIGVMTVKLQVARIKVCIECFYH